MKRRVLTTIIAVILIITMTFPAIAARFVTVPNKEQIVSDINAGKNYCTPYMPSNRRYTYVYMNIRNLSERFYHIWYSSDPILQLGVPNIRFFSYSGSRLESMDYPRNDGSTSVYFPNNSSGDYVFLPEFSSGILPQEIMETDRVVYILEQPPEPPPSTSDPPEPPPRPPIEMGFDLGTGSVAGFLAPVYDIFVTYVMTHLPLGITLLAILFGIKIIPIALKKIINGLRR